jgi:hypothetical protein
MVGLLVGWNFSGRIGAGPSGHRFSGTSVYPRSMGVPLRHDETRCVWLPLAFLWAWDVGVWGNRMNYD